MAIPQEKAQCVLRYAEYKSPVTVQRQFHRHYGRDPPSKPSILQWVHNFKRRVVFMAFLRVDDQVSVSHQTVDNIQAAFQCSSHKSVRQASLELDVPKSTIHGILHKQLHLHAYKM